MALTVLATSISIDNTMKQFIVDGTITPSANYGTSGGALPHGDTLDLSGTGVPSNALPSKVEFWSTVTQGAAPLADQYSYQPGTTQANGLLQVMSGITEFTPGNPYSGAAPTNAAGYVLHFRAWFKSFDS